MTEMTHRNEIIFLFILKVDADGYGKTQKKTTVNSHFYDMVMRMERVSMCSPCECINLAP